MSQQQPADHPEPVDLDEVRRSSNYVKALWGYRVYYTGMLASLVSLIVSCFGSAQPPLVVVPVALPLALLGYVYGVRKLRDDVRAYLSGAPVDDLQARRDRRNQFQMAIVRDAFMGRLR